MTATTITAETISDLTRDIWTSLLADDGGLVPGGLGGDDDLAATVDITGAWNGTACLSCSARAGRRAAAVMFEMDDSDLTLEEINDAVGELINVVGGNLKRLLPGPTLLSLPTVHSDGGFAVPGHLEMAQEVKFSWMDEPVVVTVWSNDS